MNTPDSARLRFLVIGLLFVLGCTAGPAATAVDDTAAPTVTVTAIPSQGTPTTSPPGPADPRLIAFGRQADGHADAFFIIRADGTGEQEVARDPAGCQMCLRWSPEGDQFLIAGLMPDGRVTTAVVAADGSGTTLLPIPDPTLNLAPGAWSPDGKRMAFDGWDDADPARRGAYLGPADGSGPITRLTDATEGEVIFGFSPDGKRVLVFGDGIVDYGPELPHAGAILVVNVDGSGVRQLNPAGSVVVQEDPAGLPASWSPDSSSVVFSARDATETDRFGALYTISMEKGSKPVELARGRGMTGVQWSPDGQWIAYHDRTEGSAVFVIGPEGGAARQVTESASCCPRWSPDSRSLVFYRGPDGHVDLWTISLDGTDLRRVTTTPGGYAGVAWAP